MEFQSKNKRIDTGRPGVIPLPLAKFIDMDREKELFEWIRGMYLEMRPEDKKDAERFFPELAESEDEKIRKALIRQFDAISMETWAGVPKTDIIAWLEKQKEQKPSTEETELNSIAFLEQMGYTCIPPKEQKPNIELIQRSWYMEGYHDREFSREPKWVIKTGEGGPRYEKNEKYGQPLEQKPKAIRMTGSFVDGSYKFDVVDMPNPSEWSEEDENKIESIKGLITTGRFADTNTIRTIWKLLDSLRPQPHWKPSEEQMEFLKRTVDGYDITCRGQVALESLYNDLKKL